MGAEVARFGRKVAEPGAGPGPSVRVAERELDHRCNLCIELVSPGERIVVCECGRAFHVACAESGGSCPRCRAGLRKENGGHARAATAPVREPPSLITWSPEIRPPEERPEERPDPAGPEVEDIYLIHRASGLLIQRRTWRRETVDADIVSGMLDAVRGFITQSFSRGVEADFSRFQHGDSEVLVCDGKLVSLAIALSGNTDEILRLRADLVKEEMQRAVHRVEDAHHAQLEKWNGDADGLRGARRSIDAVATSIARILEPGRRQEERTTRDAAAPSPPLSTLSPGLNYLILSSSPNRSYDALVRLLRDGRAGLIVSTTLPMKLKRQYSLDPADIYWLSDSDGPGIVRPERLEFEIQRIVSRFYSDHPDGVFLLDGIEYLIVSNGQERVVKFTKRVADLAGAGQGTFLVPLNPGPIPADPLGVLRRTFDRVEEGR